MTGLRPTRPAIAAAVRDYHRAFPVSEKCSDLMRARMVSAFASTVLARLDVECRDAVPDVPGRDDEAWFVGYEYFLAVAVYRTQQVLTTVLDAMHLHGRGSIMSAWPVLRSADQMNDHLQLYATAPTTQTHLQQAHAEIEAWNALGDASWDYGIPLADIAFDHLPPVRNQPAVMSPNPDGEARTGNTRTLLDAAAAVAVTNLGRRELGDDPSPLHPDTTCSTAERTLGELQAALSIDITESAATTAVRVLRPGVGTDAATQDLRSDVACAADYLRHELGITVTR
ncbi:hypothetical protein HQ308_14885 [Rhodococcus sp. BP-241]|uniref:hypothetical protein n=1 Tax=Rhodococcus sp. BP-241 TaxID=2739441 RepID=UPI001C9A5982|nr:hypothetical protein [Rhodococcus sp. BP-241]MBY6708089.1 hypothetical protein [Rhodococcus sp. BP-241]